MTTDIFQALDSAGFGSNVCEIASQGDCRVLRLEDKTGEGFMTMYRLFDGVYLMYNDFHLQSCTSHYQNAETVLCIDRCREGRIEHENALHEHYYMEAGNIRIDKRVHHRHRRTDNNSYLYLIARAIMKDAPIIVLDEATANVDPENEAELINAIEALTKEKTIIMIAHRLKTVRKADRIFVIESGRIAQQGTHEQLIAQQGIYRSFVESRREAASWRL